MVGSDEIDMKTTFRQLVLIIVTVAVCGCGYTRYYYKTNPFVVERGSNELVFSFYQVYYDSVSQRYKTLDTEETRTRPNDVDYMFQIQYISPDATTDLSSCIRVTNVRISMGNSDASRPMDLWEDTTITYEALYGDLAKVRAFLYGPLFVEGPIPEDVNVVCDISIRNSKTGIFNSETINVHAKLNRKSFIKDFLDGR